MSDHGIEYRPYQIEAKDAALKAFQEDELDSALVVMATGTGKTVVAGMIAEDFLAHEQKVLFVAHRQILIEQAFKTANKFGFECAVEMGKFNARALASEVGSAQVVVASVQSLQSDRLLSWNPTEFGIIIVDEAHRALADSYTKMLNHFQGYKLLGLTATPGRGDSRNLGSRFQEKVYDYGLRRAIRDGWLAPILTRTCPVKIDLRGLSTLGGDYNQGDLEERLGPKIEMMARALVREMEQRPTVAFTPDVGSALFLAETLTALGVPARYVAGTQGEHGGKDRWWEQPLLWVLWVLCLIPSSKGAAQTECAKACQWH